MSKKKILLLLIVTVFFIAGCNNGEATETPIPDETEDLPPVEGEIPWDMLGFSEDSVPVVISPDELIISTPITPYFAILDAVLTSCIGQDYIVITVRNFSGWTFNNVTLVADTWPDAGMVDSFYLFPEDTLFFDRSDFCPPEEWMGRSGLRPGEMSYLYLPVEHDHGTNIYDIWVSMCTNDFDSLSEEDLCAFQPYRLEVDLLEIWEMIFVGVLEDWPCYQGPGPDFENVGNLFEGEAVRLMCLADLPGWMVLMHPKYGQLCWFPKDKLDIPNPDVEKGLEVCSSPASPSSTDCPKGYEWNADKDKCVKIKISCSAYKDFNSCTIADCKWTVNGCTDP